MSNVGTLTLAKSWCESSSWKSLKLLTTAFSLQVCSHCARKRSCSSVQVGQNSRICSALQPFLASAMESTYQGSLDGYGLRPGPDTGGSTMTRRVRSEE